MCPMALLGEGLVGRVVDRLFGCHGSCGNDCRRRQAGCRLRDDRPAPDAKQGTQAGAARRGAHRPGRRTCAYDV